MTFRPFPSVRFTLALVSLIAGLLALTGSASASRTQESIFQDDRLLEGPATQAPALDELKSLGVKTIHSVVNWRGIAPNPSSGTTPSFDATNPAAYPAANWDVLDRLVKGTRDRGMGLILTLAGPAPDWAVDCNASEKRRLQKNIGTCKPDAAKFGKFAAAVAKRYNGRYVDENGIPGGTLPKVTRWSIWNEPNLNSWITPQIVSVRGKHYSVGAQLYRNLVYAAGTAIQRNGHGSDQILLGETAPIGLSTSRTSPVTFYQTLFCIDSSGRKLRGTAAKQVGCTGRFKRLPVNGVAHHPYTKGATQSLLASQNQNDITIAYISRLQRVLKQGVRAHAISAGTAGKVYFTEFGVSSRPPAAAGKGTSLAKQADFINLFEYVSYLSGVVRGVSQFQLEDDSNLLTKTFQTGIKRNSSGNFAHKPSYAAYQLPLFVDSSGKVFGGVRGLRSGTATLLHNGKKFRNVSVRSGYFLLRVHGVSGKWQLTYTPKGGKALKSRVAKAERVKLPRQ